VVLENPQKPNQKLLDAVAAYRKNLQGLPNLEGFAYGISR